MIPALRTWLLGVVLTALAGALARQMAPRGREEGMVRLAAGLLLAAALLRPLGEIQWEDLAVAAGSFPGGAEAQAERYRQEQTAALSAVIAEKTAAYIWDKANALGLDCQVTVTTAAGESGIPLPDRVTIRGPYSEALSAVIQEEVGIPAEKQIWLEGETWSEEEEGPS